MPQHMTYLPTKRPGQVGFNQLFLHKLWKDMQQTTLPTGLDAPPQRIGAKGSPSPKASQWNTMFLVTLPITLTKVWTASNAPLEDHARLDNFLHLACAIRLANRRVVDGGMVSAYQTHLLKYLRSLLHLFPEYRLKPKHHYAIHLADCMLRFGPTIWYSSWSGERKIFGQKQMHTNHLPGMLFPVTHLHVSLMIIQGKWSKQCQEWKP